MNKRDLLKIIMEDKDFPKEKTPTEKFEIVKEIIDGLEKIIYPGEEVFLEYTRCAIRVCLNTKSIGFLYGGLRLQKLVEIINMCDYFIADYTEEYYKSNGQSLIITFLVNDVFE